MMTQALNRCRNEKGMALVMTLLIIFLFTILGSVFIVRSVNEKNISEREKLSTQAYFVAETGGDAALAKLDELINTDLFNTVNSTLANVVGTQAAQYDTNNDGLGFLLAYVKVGNVAQLTQSGQQLQYNSGNINYGSGSYTYTISITQKSNPITVSQNVWDFPYFYQINTTATASGSNRKVRLDGDFTVRVQQDNFAKYALFTDVHTMSDGTTVWFTNRTSFAGPLHTNDRYSFALNPGAVFSGAVDQYRSTARFYNNGFPILADADHNGTLDVPTFQSSYARSAPQVVLASNTQQTDLQNQAKAGITNTSNGIYLPTSGGNMTGGIYVIGNASISLGVSALGNPQYTIVNGSTTKQIIYSISQNKTYVSTNGGALSFYANGGPSGVDHLGHLIYVKGAVTALNGTLQQDTQLTISSESHITITNHIRYASYTPASGTPGSVGYTPPSASGTTNLLGLVSWNGNILVSTSAPNNLDVHAIVMARNGFFQVNNYTDTGLGSRGTATLLGGVITQYYGAFGLFDGTSGLPISGYNRNFVYDSRTLMGTAPPYFPSMTTFIAFSNDLTDKVHYQEGGF